jgi:ribosomal protein S18 acetylase RimI-like enzyme
MLQSDLPSVDELSNITHPELPEAPEIFAERLHLYPAGCLVLEDAGTIQGYVISHPIAEGQPPALDTLLEVIPDDSVLYYIHDLAISSKLRGQGLAKGGIEMALAVARREGFARACLISVYGTSSFWGKYGFVRQEVDKQLAEKLQAYGEDAVFMSQSLSS